MPSKILHPSSSSELGLTHEEANKRLLHYGLNAIKDSKSNPILGFLKHFWAPVPWMLEITIFLQLFLGKYTEALVIFLLLLFNSILSFFQEARANKALLLLKNQLKIQVRVLRDGHWSQLDAQNLVPGDFVHLRMGDIIPADMRLYDGHILLDQSMLTGESLPVEVMPDTTTYAGAIVRQGEANGIITATGEHTYFGKTVNLLQAAETKSHIKTIIFSIVKYLLIIDAILAIFVAGNGVRVGTPLDDMIPFILILLIASIPVALPATFTLAMSLGAMKLAKKGVLITHLSAIEEAAIMDTLCTDKTGTLTQNALRIATLEPMPSHSEEKLLYVAALGCDASTQDPIDKTILSKAETLGIMTDIPERLKFIPFDPLHRKTEAFFKTDTGEIRIIKGAPDNIVSLLSSSLDLSSKITKMTRKGHRVLAVAADMNHGTPQSNIEFIGLIALHDPPRHDSKFLINSLKELGLRIIMLTGDSAPTAKTIASKVGIGNRVCHRDLLEDPEKIKECDVFAGLFPEDKFHLVKSLQRLGHVVGMTGDGVNDAPALKQAEVGIAVQNAVDVAKAAASIVLTVEGLYGIRSAIKASRRIYQRMLTYILNKIIKSFEIAVLLSIGFIVTGQFILTPLLMVLLLLINDFITMAIATDNVSFSQKPERWEISSLMAAGGLISLCVLVFSFGILFAGKYFFNLSLGELQTLIFVMLAFTTQGGVYLIRDRGHFWNSKPSSWLVSSTICDIIIVSILSTQGILMTAINPLFVLGLAFIIPLYLMVIDFLKVHIFSYFKIR